MDQRTHVQLERGYFGLWTDRQTDRQPKNIMPPAPKGGGIISPWFINRAKTRVVQGRMWNSPGTLATPEWHRPTGAQISDCPIWEVSILLVFILKITKHIAIEQSPSSDTVGDELWTHITTRAALKLKYPQPPRSVYGTTWSYCETVILWNSLCDDFVWQGLPEVIPTKMALYEEAYQFLVPTMLRCEE